jgi:hypothetical protein
MSTTARTAILTLGLSLQLLFPWTALAAPVSMNLSSTSKTITSTVSGSIHEGGTVKTISVNQMITPAERVALLQVLNGGHQTLVLGNLGNAVRGSLAINSTNTTGGITDFVLPKAVTAVDTLAALSLTGDLTNSGSLYALSTNASQTTDSIGAADINNMHGGLISTVLPSGNLGYTNVVSGLGLSLSAINNIANAGIIKSAGALTLAAGGSITNALPSGATGTATIQSVGNLTMLSSSITNSGLITSTAANINIGSQIATNLMIDNTKGTIQASSGNINVRDASFTGNYNLSMSVGDWTAKAYNLFSGDGTIYFNADCIKGMVNANGGSAQVINSSGALNLGAMNLSGDPTFYNTGGDIILDGDMAFNGQDLAIIASGNILNGSCHQINTSSGNGGGAITMIAGANMSVTNGGSSNLPPGTDNGATVNVLGGAAGGGKIDLTTGPLTEITSVGGANNGGNITIVAYGGSTAGSGTVAIPSGATITSGSAGTDNNGNVTIFAGAASGTGISVGSIDTHGSSNGTGNVYLNTANPILTGCTGCTGSLQIVNGTILAGKYNVNPNQAPAPGNSSAIAAGNITSSGGSIQMLAGGTINAGAVSTSGSTATGVNGGIAMLSGAPSGVAINATSMTTSGSLGNSGNITLITAATTSPLCSSCSYKNLGPNTDGGIVATTISASGNVDLRAGGDLSATTITAMGAGSRNGGQVGIIVDNSPSSTGTFQIGTTGSDAVGTITSGFGSVGEGGIGVTSAGPGGITVANQSALVLTPIASGNGGQIGLNAEKGTLTTPGTWNLSGVVQGQGGFLNLAGQSITFTSDLNVNVNGVGATGGASGGRVNITATNLVLPANAATITAIGAGSAGSGGSIVVSSSNNTTIGAGLTMTATGSGTSPGGLVDLGATNTLDISGGNVTISTSSAGFGGRVNVFGGTTVQGASNLSVDANGSSVGGGSISFAPGAWSYSGGSTTLNANSDQSDGGFVSITATTINGGSGAVNASANGASATGFGGAIRFTAQQVTAGSGGMTLSANGGVGGGEIQATLDSFSGGSVLALNANGAGTAAGTGGVIDVYASGAGDSLVFGNQAGQISASATGYATDGSSQAGGLITIATAANLTINGAGINVSTLAPNSDGGSLSFTAGTGGQGVMQLIGNFSVNATGNGNAGTIALSYADSHPLNSVDTAGTAVVNVANLTAQAPGTGAGGSITVNNSLTTSPVGIANNGTINVTSASGSTGSLELVAAGTISAPTQDISVVGSGTFAGPVIAIGKNVSFNLSNSAAFNVSNIQAIGGNLTMSVPNLVLADNTAILTSTGAATITTTNLTNNSNISAGSVLTVTSAGNLAISGTGTLTGSSLTISSTGGSVNAEQGTFSSIVSGTAATSYTLTSDAASLSVGSVTANNGNVTLLANAGNLTLKAGSAITANMGNVMIEDSNMAGIITFESGVSVNANSNTGTAGTGDVFCVIGPVPGSPTNTTAPSNMAVTTANGGQVFFGVNSIASECCNQSSNANGAQIVFNTGSDPATNIVLTTGDTFTAFNQAPAPPPPPPPPVALPPGHGGTPPGLGGFPPGLGGNLPPGLGGTPPGQGGTPPGQQKKAMADDQNDYQTVGFVQTIAGLGSGAASDSSNVEVVIDTDEDAQQ